MRYGFLVLAAVVLGGAAVVAYQKGDGKGFERSVVNGVGWGVGRELAHQVLRHVFH